MRLATCLTIGMFLEMSAYGDTWTVDDDLGDNPNAQFTCIQSAVDAASDGDEIIVWPGTYWDSVCGEWYEQVNMLGKSVWLRSIGGPEVTIIDGLSSVRGIACVNGETADCRIEGFTITNCRSTDFDYDGNGTLDLWEDGCGGGVYVLSSSPTIIDCIITSNLGTGWDFWWGADIYSFGGGIYMRQSSAEIAGCVISDNSANDVYMGDGGGIYIDSSTPTITDCLISWNLAGGFYQWGGAGGGLAISLNSNPSITNCTIANNSTNDFYSSPGGGLFIAASTATITDCLFAQNSATYGGAIACWNASPTLVNVATSENTTTKPEWGDGIYARLDSTVSIGGSYTSNGDNVIFINVEPPYTNPGATLAFEAESTCQVDGDVTASPQGATAFDIDELDTTASLLCQGTLTRQGSLAITNNSGSLADAQAGDILPLAEVDVLLGQFTSIVFPVVPPDLALQLIEQPAERGGATEIAVEVIATDTPDFTDPFSGDLDHAPVDLVSFDVDADGIDELAVLFDGTPGFVVAYSVTEGAAPTPIPNLTAVVGNGPVDIDAADLDGDGDDDLVVANRHDSTITILTSIDGPAFASTLLAISGTAQGLTCASAIDWDGDDRLDAAVGVDIDDQTYEDGYRVLLDINGSSPGVGPWLPTPLYDTNQDPNIAEWEGDPPTAATGGLTSSQWGFAGSTLYGRILRGSSAAGSLEVISDLGGFRIQTIEALDLDDDGGDGQVDLMVASNEAQSIYLFQGDQGEPNGFGDLIPLDVGVAVEDVVAIDADLDGDTDMVLAAPSSDTPLLLLRNDGVVGLLDEPLGGRTWSKQVMGSGGSVNQLASGDVDPGDVGDTKDLDDWVAGTAPLEGLRGELGGTMEQTNLFGRAAGCNADLDGSGTVGVGDLLVVIDQWGSCKDCSADLNNDGTVGVADLLAIIDAWGPCQ